MTVLFISTVLLFIYESVGITGSVSYDYDELNRLVKVERADEYIIEYSYDPAGNRNTKTIQVLSVPFDYDADADIDGLDLATFQSIWDGSITTLGEFSNNFGKNNL